MLQLEKIRKEYITGDLKQIALNGISINFRNNEFVAILGPSGSGKTTLLNIVGGLDRYDSGDLIINGISTRNYSDRDWDSYRNHSVGFVFQSYNLIPHQSVLSNVELALTISGISKQERRERATKVLEQVGLGDQLHKKPNQMSGGQMQRVAIARALVNDPDILLADEPTGALDTETSVQVMNLLQEVAKDKLVIMVTHNPELANEYATRVVNLRDGDIIGDSDPYKAEKAEKIIHKNMGKTKMSFMTALSLSLNNLSTKKARTALTAFAGSIGIIGIALILALSNGVNMYISDVQRDTLSSYPLIIESESMDINSMMNSMMGQNETDEHDFDKVYSNNISTDMMSMMSAQLKKNDLASFKEYIGNNPSINDYISTIQYGYDLDLQIYSPDVSDGVTKLNPSEAQMTTGVSIMGSNVSMNAFEEMLGNRDLLTAQYDVLAGRFPDEGKANEVVLVVDENNEISDMMLYGIGLMDPQEYKEMEEKILKGEEVEPKEVQSYSYEEILDTTFKLVINTDVYTYNESEGIWEDKSGDTQFMKGIVEDAMDLEVVGILKPNPEASASSINGAIAYNSALVEYVSEKVNASTIVKEQLADEETNVMTGLPFDVKDYTENMSMEEVQAFMSTLSSDEQMQFAAMTANMSEEEVISLVGQIIRDGDEAATYESVLNELGVINLEKPSKINIYPSDFEAKDDIESYITDYNTKMTNDGKEDMNITYTDIAGLMMSSVSVIINMITYVLIGFVSISLIVSSIMIGIITYISVLERTKEIGILRSIGASKGNISSIFNAETLIVGLFSGVLGIGVTLLILWPVNAIIESLTGVSGIAVLPWNAALILITISVVLSVIAGIIPSKKAAKQDPVTALRSE